MKIFLYVVSQENSLGNAPLDQQMSLGFQSVDHRPTEKPFKGVRQLCTDGGGVVRTLCGCQKGVPSLWSGLGINAFGFRLPGCFMEMYLLRPRDLPQTEVTWSVPWKGLKYDKWWLRKVDELLGSHCQNSIFTENWHFVNTKLCYLYSCFSSIYMGIL